MECEGVSAPSKMSTGLHYFTIVLNDEENLNDIISSLGEMNISIQKKTIATLFRILLEILYG
jgi:hypothetical protein